MYSYNYSNLDRLRWLAEILKKGYPSRPDSETNEPPLRTYQLWKKTFYEETHKLDDMTELPKSQPKKTYEEDLESEIVRVKMPSRMPFLGYTNVYDNPIGNLDKMGDEVENPSPQSTPQVLPSFEEYTSPVTYSKEVEETLGTPMEVEPLDQTKQDDVGLTNHNISLRSRKVPSFDEPEPQPQPLPSFPSLDINLRDERGPEPPIKPHNPDSFRVKNGNSKKRLVSQGRMVYTGVLPPTTTGRTDVLMALDDAKRLGSHQDKIQIDDLDLEKDMDINWQIAMTAIKIKMSCYKKTSEGARVETTRGRKKARVDGKKCMVGLFDNEKWVNKANLFTPRLVQLNNIRPNLSTASKTIKTGRVNVNTGHGNVSSVSSAGTQFKSGASRFNTGKQHVSSGRMIIHWKHMEHRGIFDRWMFWAHGLVNGPPYLKIFKKYPKWDCYFWRSNGSISGKDEVDVPTNPTLRIHNAHPQSQILGDPNTPVQTRSSLKKITEAHALYGFWLILPNGANGARYKWVYRNKKDERGSRCRNKARMASSRSIDKQEGIDYDEVLAPVAELKLSGGKALYGIAPKAPRAGMLLSSTFLVKLWGYKRGTVKRTVFIQMKQKRFQVYSQAEQGRLLHLSRQGMLLRYSRKFDMLHVKALAINPMETKLPLTKDEEAYDVHQLYHQKVHSLLRHVIADSLQLDDAIHQPDQKIFGNIWKRGFSKGHKTLLPLCCLVATNPYCWDKNIAAQAPTQPIPPPQLYFHHNTTPYPTSTTPTSNYSITKHTTYSVQPTSTTPLFLHLITPPPPPETEPPTALCSTPMWRIHCPPSLLTITCTGSKRYKRRKESTGKKVVSSLDFQEDNTGAEKINTAGEVNAASIEVNTASKVKLGKKAPMLSRRNIQEDKGNRISLQEEASLAEAIRLDKKFSSTKRRGELSKFFLDAL
ncbi:hypothetical protein Tco_0368705 [Tanacetum coccineum]